LRLANNIRRRTWTEKIKLKIGKEKHEIEVTYHVTSIYSHLQATLS
jgi:hypothetical protein